MQNADQFLFLAITLGPLILGIEVLVVLWLLPESAPGSRGEWWRGVLKGTAWIVVAVWSLFASLFFVAVVIVIAVMAYYKHVQTQQYSLLKMLAVCADRGIPLAPAIHAFAQERRGTLRSRAERLAEMLAAGVSLPEAAQAVRGVLPDESLPLLRVGHETGSMTAALRQAATNQDLQPLLWQTLLPKVAYLCFVPWFGLLVFTFIMLTIVPQFQKIFLDFGMKLPAGTAALIATSEVLGHNWFFFVPVMGAVLVLLAYAVARYTGVIHADLPGIGWLVRRLDTAAILDALALVAARQQPLVQGIAALAESYPKWPIRRRLQRVLRDVQGGADWCESLLHRGLLRRADRAVLQAATRVGNLPWAMREMADSNRRRFAYRVYAWVQVLFPPVVLAFGLVLAFVVMALFLPLVSLINALVRA